MSRIRALLPLIALAATVLASPSRAEDCALGSPTATLLHFDQSDADTRQGLVVALRFGFDPAVLPDVTVKTGARTCARGAFVNGVWRYEVYGSDFQMPPRWAASPPRPKVFAYLELLPKPDRALDWSRHAAKGEDTAHFTQPDMMYALTVSIGRQRFIYAYFDSLPDDETLGRAFCSALSGDLPVVGVIDMPAQSIAVLDAMQTPAKIPACSQASGS
jgi:hypothetical protein